MVYFYMEMICRGENKSPKPKNQIIYKSESTILNH